MQSIFWVLVFLVSRTEDRFTTALAVVHGMNVWEGFFSSFVRQQHDTPWNPRQRAGNPVVYALKISLQDVKVLLRVALVKVWLWCGSIKVEHLSILYCLATNKESVSTLSSNVLIGSPLVVWKCAMENHLRWWRSTHSPFWLQEP